MRLSVRLWQTALFVAVIMVAALVLATALFSRLNESIANVSRDQLTKDSAELAGVVAPYFPVGGGVKKRDRVRLQADRFISTYDYDYDAWIYDVDGTEVYARQQRTPSGDLLTQAKASILTSGPSSDVPFLKVVLGSRELAIATHVIRSPTGRKVGGVIVAARTTGAAEIVMAVRSPMVLAFFAAVLAAGLLGMLFSEIITRQIRAMSSAASAIADGDFGQRLRRGHAPDEIADLAESFNRMAEKLGEAFAAIRGQEREIAAVVESIAEGVIAVDPGRIIRLANPVAANMLGTTVDSLVSQRIEEGLSGEELLGAVDQALVGKAVCETVQLGGRALMLSATPFATGDDKGGAVLLMRDVTEQKRWEAAQREFTANASHEMRTPIASLKGFVELLQGDAKEKPEVRDKFLRTMQAEIDRLQRLVADLFTLAQLDSGQMHLELGPHLAGDLVWDVQAVMAPLADDAGIRMDVDVADSDLSVVCDRELILQVLLGFADNAIKHSPRGANVTLWAKRDQGRVCMGVRDTGPGIRGDAKDRVFDRFFSSKARPDGRRGTGLGLAIAKEIVEAHGSHIQVESEPGQGADFYFSLPASAPAGTVPGSIGLNEGLTIPN